MQCSFETDLGPITVTVDDGAVTGLSWGQGDTQDTDPVLREAARQMRAYFAGTLTGFDLPLAVRGSEFQKAVCDEMRRIPFGETVTYGDIAQKLNAPPQAVGQACGGNPIPIVIPCHRVLAANGLGGFSARGGIETKVALLRHEGAASLLI